MVETDLIRTVSGVGSATAKKLEKLGIVTVRDALYHFPFRVEDRSLIKPIATLEDGEEVSVRARVVSDVSVRRIRKNLSIYTLTLRDDSGFINAVWYNNRYVMNSFKQGEDYAFFGQVKCSYGKRELQNPVYEASGKAVSTGRIVPVYASTAGLSQKILQQVMLRCLSAAEYMTDPLPTELLEKEQLPSLRQALWGIHAPKTAEEYSAARRRLIFEEFFLLNMGMRLLAGRRSAISGRPYQNTDDIPFWNNAPFAPTAAQSRVSKEIAKDLARSVPMNRLVQGDVGSGKTALAAMALYLTHRNGHQGAMMAPTELLARQHFESLSAMLPDVPMVLLTGSTTSSERRSILSGLESGEVAVAVGTHALFSADVAFSDLTLVVTDEQHRFGVRQRAALSAKSQTAPHILVMTATPIPRTLALILYSDLDISVIDELPPGRQAVKTYVVDESMRRRIYAFIDKTVEAGGQVYIVCPMVEESDAMELKSVVAFAENLKTQIFPARTVGFIHGKMKSDEKEAVMSAFASGALDILVSTTVIEVGVNVPNATLMVVENAERFGLSQLHQLRGRVGRGRQQSYCVLFAASGTSNTRERMNILAKTNDGFQIAAKDLELRGPGEIFGTRQHGLPELRLGDLARDTALMNDASRAADALLRDDPALSLQAHRAIRTALSSMFSGPDAAGMFN